MHTRLTQLRDALLAHPGWHEEVVFPEHHYLPPREYFEDFATPPGPYPDWDEQRDEPLRRDLELLLRYLRFTRARGARLSCFVCR